MFNFLRKLRLRMFEQSRPIDSSVKTSPNKGKKSIIISGITKKYLIYAIGEVMLVVVGILLALQINNWNEKRKAQIIENEYLLALQNEFEANKDELDHFVKLNLELIESAKDLLKLTGPNNTSNTTEEKVNSLLIDLIKASVEYEPSPGILEDLISSGNLNNLSNRTLRKQLSDWKATLAKVRRQENTVLEYRSNIKDLLIEKGNTRRPITGFLQIDEGSFDHKNISLLSDRRLENNLSFFAISSESLGTLYYGELNEIIIGILQTIRDQLQN